jgi:hypothetical protein
VDAYPDTQVGSFGIRQPATGPDAFVGLDASTVKVRRPVEGCGPVAIG